MPNEVITPNQADSSAAGNTSDTEARTGIEITPELVQQVADRVYALLIADLSLERERTGMHDHRTIGWKGGR